MFLLDTDHIGILQIGMGAECVQLKSRMDDYVASDFYFPIISFHEQVVGWNAYVNRAKSSSGVVHGYRMFERVLADFAKRQIALFDERAAVQFDVWRQQRIRIGTMDLRIAAIALVRGYTVLSRNLVDFQKVPGLAAEDWTKP